jgi:hypothetical protein
LGSTPGAVLLCRLPLPYFTPQTNFKNMKSITYTIETSNLINNFIGEQKLTAPGEIADFNTLMQIADKVQRLDESFSFDMGYALMSSNGLASHYAYCDIHNWKGETVADNSGTTTLIEAVYITVIDFIKWYNANKT